MLSLLAFPASTTNALVKRTEHLIFLADKDRARGRAREGDGALQAELLFGKSSIIKQTQDNFKMMKDRKGIQLFCHYQPFQPNTSDDRMPDEQQQEPFHMP